MALKLALNLPTGVECSEAYVRVKSVQYLNRPSGTAMVTIAYDIFFSEETRISGKAPLDTVSVSVTSLPELAEDMGLLETYFGLDVLDARNPVAAAYIYLKSLAQFTGAIDA